MATLLSTGRPRPRLPTGSRARALRPRQERPCASCRRSRIAWPRTPSRRRWSRRSSRTKPRWPRRCAGCAMETGKWEQGLAAPARLLVPHQHRRSPVAPRPRGRSDGRGALEPQAHAADPAGAAPRRVQRALARRAGREGAGAQRARSDARRRSSASSPPPASRSSSSSRSASTSGTPSPCAKRTRRPTASSSTCATPTSRPPSSADAQPLFIRSRNLSARRTAGAGDPPLGELPPRRAGRRDVRQLLRGRTRRR